MTDSSSSTPYIPGGPQWNSMLAEAQRQQEQMPPEAAAVRLLDPQGFDSEVARRRAAGPVTEQTYRDVANGMVVARLPQLDHLNRVQQANAADLSGMDSYASHLQQTGLDQASLVEAVQRMYPGLTKAQALEKWTASARRTMSSKQVDMRLGSDYDSYDPNRSTPRESSD